MTMNMMTPRPDRSGTIELGARQEQFRRPDAWRVRLAQDEPTRRDAFALRYLCYASKGYIDPTPDRQFSDAYDLASSNLTLVLYDDERPIGSIRVCTIKAGSSFAPAIELPLAKTFPGELAALLEGGKTAVELNRLVCHPDYAGHENIVLTLGRMADHFIRKLDPDFIASCVRTNHVAFWKRLRFEHVAGPRLYAGLKFSTSFLVVARDKFNVVRHVLPTLRITQAEAAAYDRLSAGETIRVFGHD